MMKNSLLFDENPLIIMPGLAVAIGLHESIFVQQLHYWLNKSGKVKEGNHWVYNTVPKWNEQFPFWSESTLRRTIKKLENDQIVVTGNFNKLPIDKTKWYRIDYEILNSICSKSIESRKRESSSQVDHMDRSDWSHGQVNLNRPLPEITTEITTEIEVVVDNGQSPESEKETAFSFFEKNGFGILTPHIGEKIGAWIDDVNEELVIHALKLAAENGVLRWNYVEGILRDWEKRKLTTVDQVRAEAERYKREGGRNREAYGNKTSKSHESTNGSYNGIKF